MKFLDDLTEKRRAKILEILKSLENFPLIRADIRKIGDRTFRLRSGDIRIIFDFDKHKNTVFVKQVDYRGKVYKK
ncbi:type II toxin-antitoxin system RelE family toxin [Geoglobus acetivorans]|uniref:type II toxin-antitoxin system RelE family toxin n=1 Tax=Geoglobus acetivorans TaxID=565033 RepID=UPI00296FFDEC